MFFVKFLVLLFQIGATLSTRPHVLFILADDCGFNDVGYHGSEIRTPNLDTLASEGVKLENYYVQPLCSPTRSQLMTGRYQIHTGMQHGVIQNGQPRALPLDSQILPEKLQDAGYITHMIGKWHLGFYSNAVLPTSRGFSTFYGFYSGGQDYYTHTGRGSYDFRDGNKVDYSANGTYSTHLFAQRAIDIVSMHDANTSMFIYLALQSPHTPLQVPRSYEEPYDSVISNAIRKTYAGMVACMDEAIGNVTAAFKRYGLWDNTVLIFSTDNGGNNSRNGGADNSPLRGGKRSLWEGGMRGVAFVRSNLLTGGVVSKGLLHVSDWFPTIIRLANGNSNRVDLDGFDQWDALSGNSQSPRTELLHNIDPLFAVSGISSYDSSYFETSCRAAIRKGDMKLITGNPERGNNRFSQNVWLFNITADPNEETDLSTDRNYASTIMELLGRLKYYNSTSVTAFYPDVDSRSSPGRNRVWGPWM